MMNKAFNEMVNYYNEDSISDKYFDEESISINESVISNYSDRILNKINTFVVENYDLQVTQFTANVI